jgi:hypothetical protein
MVQGAGFHGMAYCGQDGSWHEAYSNTELDGEIRVLDEQERMQNPGNGPNLPGKASEPSARDGQLDAVLRRIDLVALLTAALGAALLGVALVVTAAFQLGKLVSMLWADSFDRRLVVVLALAVIWVAVRWKRLCVF